MIRFTNIANGLICIQLNFKKKDTASASGKYVISADICENIQETN